MKAFVAAAFCLQLATLMSAFPDKGAKRASVIDKGDYVLLCSHEPIEFGIVLDSSSSITTENFYKARQFLVQFMGQFDIGSGKNDIRVSIITFGKGIYPEDGFNLDTFKTKEEVLDHLAHMKHRSTPRTDTGAAIQYMHDHQLSEDKVRPHAQKISLVITDGNSQNWPLTRDQAALARADNITMFALGVGNERDVGMPELLRIAGDEERVTRVDTFDNLDAIKGILAKKTCIKKKKPTTTPMPKTESCGEKNPGDIEFFFSPADMGIDATAWTTSFISGLVDSDIMKDGFRYGASTGSCPDDAGFKLNRYDNAADVKERLQAYDRMSLPSLLNTDVFSESNGGRTDARDVAVIVVNDLKGTKGGELEAKVKELTDNGVEVFIANPAGQAITIGEATGLEGRSSRAQSENLVSLLCPAE